MKLATFYAFLSIVFMSIGPTINKFSLLKISPFSLVFYNASLCVLFSLPFIYKKIKKIQLNELKQLLIAGLFNGISMFFLFYGLDKSSPVLVSMLNRSYIIFSILLAAFVLKEKIAKSDWALILAAVSGIILFMYKDNIDHIESGAFYGLLSGAFFSLCNFTIKNKLKETSEYIILFSINLVTALLFFLITITKVTNGLNLPFELKSLSLIFIGAFFGSFLGILFFYYSIKKIPFYKANLYRSLSPVLTLFIGIAFFPVQLTKMNWIGLILLISSFIFHAIFRYKYSNNLILKKTKKIPTTYHSVLIYIRDGKKWLMVKNKNRGWEFPGGHKENNETFLETAEREAYEEAGVKIKNCKYKGFYRLSSGHTTLIVKADIDEICEMPKDFETLERKFVFQLPNELSFSDEIYPWIIKNF